MTKAITIEKDQIELAFACLCQGDSTREVAKRLGVSKTKLLSTLTKTRELQDQYRMSLLGKAALHASEIVDIADDKSIPVDRAKLMVHAREWEASKLLYHIFGDVKAGNTSINLSTTSDKPLVIQLVNGKDEPKPIDTITDV